MNWRIETKADTAATADLEVVRGTMDDPAVEPAANVVEAARAAAIALASALGEPALVTIDGHQTTIDTDEDGFMAGHVQMTVSKLQV